MHDHVGKNTVLSKYVCLHVFIRQASCRPDEIFQHGIGFPLQLSTFTQEKSYKICIWKICHRLTRLFSIKMGHLCWKIITRTEEICVHPTSASLRANQPSCPLGMSLFVYRSIIRLPFIQANSFSIRISTYYFLFPTLPSAQWNLSVSSIQI